MDQKRFEIAIKCNVYRDINRRLLEADLITKAMFDILEKEVLRIETMPIRGDDLEIAKPARKVTILEPTKDN